ncbi:hypothetical protein EGW08_021893, partial [Elysia chlorotica]
GAGVRGQTAGGGAQVGGQTPGGGAGDSSSTRARSSFLVNLYSQRQTTPPGNTHSSRFEDRRTEAGDEGFKLTRPSQQNSPVPLPASNITLSGASKAQDMHSYPDSAWFSQRNVLTPRGVSHQPHSISTDLAETRSVSPGPQAKQVRFKDDDVLKCSNVKGFSADAERLTEQTQTSSTPRYGTQSVGPSPAILITPATPTVASPGGMVSESTQTNKSALLRHLSTPLNDIADAHTKRSTALDSSALFIPSPGASILSESLNQPSRNNLVKSSSGSDLNLRIVSPPGLPLTFPR